MIRRGHKSILYRRGWLHHREVMQEFSKPGAPYHDVYQYRPLPGAGANQYARETELLPTYPPAGLGVPNGGGDWNCPREHVINGGQIVGTPSGPVLNAVQGAPLYLLGDPGTQAGQFMLQPLTNTNPSSAAFAGFGPPLLRTDMPVAVLD